MSLNKSGPVVILSSLVAGSRVGGGVASDVLSQAGFWPQHVPTVIFGRHPGHGAPGGGSVPDGVFGDALKGLVATKQPPQAILTGYFATSKQVQSAAQFIQSVKSDHPDCYVLVDPILGDGDPDASDNGLYISRPVAESIRDELLPLADLITPNVYEFSWLSGQMIPDKYAAQEILSVWPSNCIVTSVSGGNQILVTTGKMYQTLMAHVAQQRPDVDHGTGDLFAALMLRFMLQQEHPEKALQLAHQAIQDNIEAGRFARD